MHVTASRIAPSTGIRVRPLESAPLALGALALWLLLTLGLRPLLLPDEGRYANVAREMLLGDWLVPTLNGLPFFHKPPLMYWIDIVAMHAFGVTVFAARAASLVGAWLMGAALFLALRRWHGPRV
ncbi:MAG: dolichyl-phosphate-mannose--protein mannosyltransferase, partial [Burkholderiaceae bacterium]